MPNTLRSTSPGSSPPGEGDVPEGGYPAQGPSKSTGAARPAELNHSLAHAWTEGIASCSATSSGGPSNTDFPSSRRSPVPLPARSPKRAGWSQEGKLPAVAVGQHAPARGEQRKFLRTFPVVHHERAGFAVEPDPPVVGLRFVEGHQLDIVQPRKPDRCALSHQRIRGGGDVAGPAHVGGVANGDVVELPPDQRQDRADRLVVVGEFRAASRRRLNSSRWRPPGNGLPAVPRRLARGLHPVRLKAQGAGIHCRP